MIDYARITVKAGNGGNGAGSFHKIKGRRYGKADGGDGGRGGDVYIEATSDLSGLDKYRFVKDYRAWSGEAGLSRLRRGARGEDLILKVPVGAVIKISSFKLVPFSDEKQISNLEKDAIQQAYDLTENGQRVLVARGGEGGRGNAKLRDDFGRRPRAGEKGEQGEALALTLELKLIADVGLVGLPNAGKSTLLAALTAARPAIAPYPFTTLEPNLGVLTFSGPVSRFLPAPSINSGQAVLRVYPERSRRAVGIPSTPATRKSSLIIADIPGLIEGASSGRGLGDLFLRHIERTKLLVHLLDGSIAGPVSSFHPAPSINSGQAVLRVYPERSRRAVGSPPTAATRTSELWHNYQTVRKELSMYSKELSGKKEIIAINKIDQMSESAKEEARAEFKKHRKKIFLISAKSNEGIDQLLKEIWRRIRIDTFKLL